MSKLKPTQKLEFDNIIRLIEEARSRAFSKVNAELVLLYFNVGKIVSSKVADGIWGEGTVDELANYIDVKIPGMAGFNRRGLYRMKQFYETYSISSDCYKFWRDIHVVEKQSSNVSLLATHLETLKTSDAEFVSSLPTQLQNTDNQYGKFVSSLMTQVSWTHHLMVLSKTKSPEEKFFYILSTIKEKLSVSSLINNNNGKENKHKTLQNNRRFRRICCFTSVVKI